MIKYTYPKKSPVIKLDPNDLVPLHLRKGVKLDWVKERDVNVEKDLKDSVDYQRYIAMLLEDIRDNLIRARRPKHF